MHGLVAFYVLGMTNLTQGYQGNLLGVLQSGPSPVGLLVDRVEGWGGT